MNSAPFSVESAVRCGHLLRRQTAKQADGCWMFMGANIRGYGRIKIGNSQVGAHRIAWTLKFGRIPADMDVLHKCDVRSCVNPSHLFLGTQADNVADMDAKGRRGKPSCTACLVSGHYRKTCPSVARESQP